MRIALDDFGAGFCNFRYLKLLPLHYLKLDRSMIEGIADDPRDLAVLRAIVAMAKALDLEVIAEGIESEAQRAIAARGLRRSTRASSRRSRWARRSFWLWQRQAPPSDPQKRPQFAGLRLDGK